MKTSRVALAGAAATLWLAFAGRSWCDELAPSRSRFPSTPATKPEQISTPFADPVYRQFDFWVGNWNVVDVERPSVVVAHARVELILDRCVLHEIYEATDGHRGESFTIYDVTRNVWHQSWVTDRGQLLTIEGRQRGDALILEGTDRAPDGKTRKVRGEWRREGRGVREVASRSLDGGATWQPWFDLLFNAASPAAQ